MYSLNTRTALLLSKIESPSVRVRIVFLLLESLYNDFQASAMVILNVMIYKLQSDPQSYMMTVIGISHFPWDPIEGISLHLVSLKLTVIFPRIARPHFQKLCHSPLTSRAGYVLHLYGAPPSLLFINRRQSQPSHQAQYMPYMRDI